MEDKENCCPHCGKPLEAELVDTEENSDEYMDGDEVDDGEEEESDEKEAAIAMMAAALADKFEE